VNEILIVVVLRQKQNEEVMKRIARSSIRIRKMSVRALWRGRPPLKRKKRLLVALGAGDIGVLTTLKLLPPSY
jgi:hypothetical protein